MQDLAGEEGPDYRSMIPHDLRENKKISSFRHLISSVSSSHLNTLAHVILCKVSFANIICTLCPALQ